MTKSERGSERPTARAVNSGHLYCINPNPISILTRTTSQHKCMVSTIGRRCPVQHQTGCFILSKKKKNLYEVLPNSQGRTTTLRWGIHLTDLDYQPRPTVTRGTLPPTPRVEQGLHSITDHPLWAWLVKQNASNLFEAIMFRCLAQGHYCHDWDST